MEQFTFISERKGTIKEILQYYCTGLTNIDITKALKNKDVKVNGVRVNSSVNIEVKDEISIYYIQKKYYKIIYEDNNILVVNKLKSIETNSFENKQTLLTELQKKYATVLPIHRLDVNTLGLMIFALNKTAEEELIKAFKSGKVEKKYFAVVSAQNVKESDNFQDSFIKNEKSGQVKFGKAKNDGNDARLEYVLIDKKNDLANILVTLHTGKTHQIRAQLSYHHIYILGDGKYGDKNLNRKYKKNEQQLKSVYLKFSGLNKLKYIENFNFEILLNELNSLNY